MSGRSWWQARYQGGKTLAEWDTSGSNMQRASGIAIPTAAAWRSTRWEEIEKRGMVMLRLLTPDGRVGALETNNPDGRFVQLKVGGFDTPGGSYTAAHVIGVVDDAGKMMCWAWERAHNWQPNLVDDGVRCYVCNLPETDCASRKGQLVYFADDVFAMKYRRIGALSLTVQGVKL